MLARLRQTGLLWPTLAMTVALAILLALGTWQLRRKVWKETLLARLDAAATAEPVQLRDIYRAWSDGEDVDYRRVKITSHAWFEHDHERLFYAPAASGTGWLVHTPLWSTTPAGLARKGHPLLLVVVNRGWLPDALREPAKRPASLIGPLSGEQRSGVEPVATRLNIVGWVRFPEPRGRFRPDNEPARNVWFWRDVDAMLAGVERLSQNMIVLPFTIEVDASAANPGGWPKGRSGADLRTGLSNRHLEYALTWYGLAATLIGVYLAFARGRRREVAQRS